MSKYPEYILEKLRQREGLDEKDMSSDQELNQLSKSEAFSEVLTWDGFIGWDNTIKGYVQSIYGIDLDKL